jgi:DNA-binding transcriptional LysR family regulator
MAPTETLYRFFADHHLEPKIAFRIDTTDAVKEAVIQEMGLALIPKIACTRELTNKLITALPIQSNLLNHNCHLISRRERPHNKMTAAFKQSVIDFFAQGNI